MRGPTHTSPMTFTPRERAHDAAPLKPRIPISVNNVTLKQRPIICKVGPWVAGLPLFYLSAYLTHYCHLDLPHVWKAVQFSCAQAHTPGPPGQRAASHLPAAARYVAPFTAPSCHPLWVWKHAAAAAGVTARPTCPSSTVLYCLATYTPPQSLS